MGLGKTPRLILLSSGIFVFFFSFGIIQENIIKNQYVNLDGSVEYFSYSVSLVLIYNAVNYSLGNFLLLRFIKEEDSTPKLLHSVGAFVSCLAMVCAYLALQFINYPTQVVAKSCKPVPIMIFSVLLGKKKYSFKKYILVLTIVSGVIMFMYQEKPDVKKYEGFGIGEFLVLSSLFMDGIVSLVQEVMRNDYQAKPITMMVNINKWSVIYLTLFWILTKEAYTFTTFMQRHPAVIGKLCGLSFFGFLGQLCLIFVVVEFGTLPAAIITTVRKFFSVLASVLLIGNSLSLRQWIATVFVFSGLFFDILCEKSNSKTK